MIDGTVDCIATHHLPHEKDSKTVEFEYAKFGMIGLQTCYPVLKTVMPDVPEMKWVELLSIQPRMIFGLPTARIEKNAAAVLTIFSPSGHTTVTDAFLRSKSKNSAFISRELNGHVRGIVNGGNVFLN